MNTGAFNEKKIEVKNTYAYDERGNLTSQTEEKTTSLRENYAKNFVHQKSYSYDSLNRLKTEKVQTPIAIPVEDYFLIDRTYDYYDDGRLRTIKEGTTTREFQYDAHGRLTDAGGVSYTYDNYGNRLTKTKNGERISYSYTRGNILANANGAEYSYDTAGVRFRKKYNGVTTEYYLDGGKILGEDRTDANGAITKLRYFYDATGLCGVKCTKDGKSSYYSYICDAQGNVVMIVEGSAPLVRYEYDVWGNCRIYTYAKYYPEVVLDCSIGEINPFRWKSHYFDTESGLYYIEGNYYDPETGRYLNACSVSTIIDNPFSDYTLDRNGIMCDNILEFLPYLYTNFGTQSLNLISDPNVLNMVIGNQYNIDFLNFMAGSASDIGTAIKYFSAKGIHSRFLYSTKTLYMFPQLESTWRRFKISTTSYADLFGGSFRQIIALDARAGVSTILKSAGKMALLASFINLGFNLYENNWKIDSALLLDTAIDTAISVGSSGLAAGTVSLVTAGLGMAGASIPGGIAVVGVIALSALFEILIRWITGYDQ
ncbi:MAG: RHS repeat protein [Clostridia bacterium]|nr:RHS repeat protein [Clostridia bacterium]